MACPGGDASVSLLAAEQGTDLGKIVIRKLAAEVLNTVKDVGSLHVAGTTREMDIPGRVESAFVIVHEPYAPGVLSDQFAAVAAGGTSGRRSAGSVNAR